MNNIIQQVFQHAGFSNEELPLMESFSFNDVKMAFEKADMLIERADAVQKEEPEAANGKETEEEAPEETEETDDQEDEGDSGEVQEEEVEDKESDDVMSDEEVMKAIKSISDVVNGDAVDVEDEEDL